MGINSQSAAYQLGQVGSIFTDEATAVEPPVGKVIVAITFLEDTTLDTHGNGGLVADTSQIDSNDAGTAFFGTATSPGGTTGAYGTGAAEVDNATKFPAGLTIYGRWTKVKLGGASTTGGIICYFGD